MGETAELTFLLLAKKRPREYRLKEEGGVSLMGVRTTMAQDGGGRQDECDS